MNNRRNPILVRLVQLTVLSLALVSTLGVSACGDEGGGAKLEMRELATPQVTWTITGLSSEIEHDNIEAMARFVEEKTKAGNISIQVMKTDDGNTTIMLGLGGDEMIDGGLEAALREKFPVLANASIKRAEGGSMPGIEIKTVPHIVEMDKDASPEEVEDQIREALAAEGVEGDVWVEVKGEGDKKEVRVEVQAEKHQ